MSQTNPYEESDVESAATLINGAVDTVAGADETLLATGVDVEKTQDERSAGSSQIGGSSLMGRLSLMDPAALGTLTGKSTVLPRLEQDGSEPKLVIDSKERYSTRKKLGEGAAGDVDLALDNDIQRLVAIKRLKGELVEDAGIMRFADEVRMVGALEHPNIAPIHDVGLDEDGRHYFVMKYVEGETLESIIDHLRMGDTDYHRRYDFDARVSLFGEILKALQFAHDRGVIHRDIKPANVMIGSHGEVMVMDWGIAKQIKAAKKTGTDESCDDCGGPLTLPDCAELDEVNEGEPGSVTHERLYKTMDRAISGTPAYMSPEQACGRTELIDERSDVYSLSALLYELLTLRSYLPPCATLKDMLVHVLNTVPKHPFFVPSKVQSTVPTEYSHYTMKGLAKDPADRFQSIREMSEQLRRVQAGYFQVQCPMTLVKRPIHGTLHFFDHHPWLGLASASAAVVLTLGSVAIIASWLVG